MRTALRNLFMVTGSRVLDGAVRFLTVPIVLHHFGRKDFGLMALAYSLHVFLTLADFSISANVIRRFSDYFVNQQLGEVRRLARAASFVYLCIGAVNLLVVVGVGLSAETWFGLQPAEADNFFWMMLGLGISSLFTWIFSIYRQILHALQKVGWDEGLNLLSTFGVVGVLGVTLYWHLSVSTYFLLALVPPLVPMLIRMRRVQRYVPDLGFGFGRDWSVFKPLLAGTLWLLLMTLADVAANNWRPVILTQQSGLESVAEFRVIQQVAGFATLVLTGFMNVAYPIVARLDAANDQARLSLVMRQGSRLLLWGHLALLVPMAFATPLMLHLYVGQNYVQLAGWLSLWLLTLTTLHHTIISSFVITRGKVRLLALGALFNAALSLGLARLFAAQWGVAAMVLSYGVFMVFQMLVTYLLALPAAGGGSGGRALLTVLPAPVLAAGLAGGLSVALMAWMQWPLWCGAPAFLAFFALLAIGPGHVLRDLRLLR